jgi:hypothetical protein
LYIGMAIELQVGGLSIIEERKKKLIVKEKKKEPVMESGKEPIMKEEEEEVTMKEKEKEEKPRLKLSNKRQRTWIQRKIKKNTENTLSKLLKSIGIER